MFPLCLYSTCLHLCSCWGLQASKAGVCLLSPTLSPYIEGPLHSELKNTFYCTLQYIIKPVTSLHCNLKSCKVLICMYLFTVQMYELHNGGAVPVHYEVDAAVLSQLQENNFNHPLLCCLNPEGDVLPGKTAVLEWIFSPLEAKMYHVWTELCTVWLMLFSWLCPLFLVFLPVFIVHGTIVSLSAFPLLIFYL